MSYSKIFNTLQIFLNKIYTFTQTIILKNKICSVLKAVIFGLDASLS